MWQFKEKLSCKTTVYLQHIEMFVVWNFRAMKSVLNHKITQVNKKRWPRQLFRCSLLQERIGLLSIQTELWLCLNVCAHVLASSPVARMHIKAQIYKLTPFYF